MCGIAGIVHCDEMRPDPDELRRCNARLCHRGPDGEGYAFFNRAALAHRRLSIIDLAGGAQPLANEDETVWVTFNGEIYNFQELRTELERLGHVFRTHSDTEVIVHGYEAWGDRCVERLRGMFAFAIWDERRERLLLARDRLGIKPLVYRWHGGRLAFASELQALQALNDPPRDLDLTALDAYLELRYVPCPQTIFSGVRKLPPGHRLILEKHGPPVVERYWSLPHRHAKDLTHDEWLERLTQALKEALRLHLVADVGVGAFLSSGIDSSLIVALACAGSEKRLKTFTVGFAEEEFDESSGARMVAAHLGTEHYEEDVDLDVRGLLPAVVRQYGEPFADSSALPTHVICGAARRHVKVMLSGDGGDEAFAGYPWVHGLVRAFDGPDAHWKASVRRRLRRSLGALGLWKSHTHPLATLRRSRACFPDEMRERLWRRRWHGRMCTGGHHAKRGSAAGQGSVCTLAQAEDYQHYLPDDVLTKVDVASMAHGLEVRVPFLDHHVVELAVHMPERLKLQVDRDPRNDGMRSKIALRALLRRHLPPEVSERPKRGFGMPLHRWAAALEPHWLADRLMASSSRLPELFNRDALAAHVENPSRTGASRLWSLLVLDEWFQQNPQVRVGPA